MSHLIQLHGLAHNGISIETGLDNTSLSVRDRAVASISTLASMGHCTDRLNSCVQDALKAGIHTEEEILDLFQYTGWLSGNVRTLGALRATSEILSSARKVDQPLAYSESLIRLKDHDTMVRDTRGGDDGVPIVLIHALSLDSRMWRDVLPALASSTGARVIAYDLRGHGYARGAPLTQSLEHLCLDLKLLLDALYIPRADVHGASYGGSIAQYFALDYPDRVRSLGLIATFGEALPGFADRAERAERDGTGSLIAETMIRWFQPEMIALNPWCIRYERTCIERAHVEEWAAAWRAMSRQDNLARLETLTLPVMVLSGTHDASATPAIMQAIVAACKNTDAEFVSVERGTHMMIMEQCSEVAKTMVAFRNQVDQKTRSAENGSSV